MLLWTVHVLVVIPARIGSSRLPHKPLCLLHGQPLIRIVARRAVDYGLGRVVVASDDARVLRAVSSLAVDTVLTSPTHSSGTARVAEVVERPEYTGCGIVVNLQCDQPFVPREVVRGAIGCVEAGFPVGSAAVSLAADDQENPNRVKVVVAGGGRAVSFTRSPLYATGCESGNRVLHHVGVYAYTRAALLSWVASPQCEAERLERLEQLRPLRQGVPIGVACFDIPPPLAIDTRDDVRLASLGFVGSELLSRSRMSA